MGKYSDLKFDWQSEITAKMGYGLQTRRMLRPLIEGGADIKFIPDEDYLPAHMKIDDPFWNSQIEASKNKPDTNLRICYCLPPRYKPNPNAITVGYTMWETDKYPREWVNHINKTCDLFFSGCAALTSSAVNGGITRPIIPMYATLDVSSWTKEGPVLNINEIEPSCIKFLFIGNFIARKNLDQLLLGFAVAFEGVTDVALVIKTWAQNNDSVGKKHIAEGIRHMYNKATGLAHKPKVSIISDILDEDQVCALIRSCDAYVSVSKGEGFDLPLMQAMAMERLVISTPFLAHKDYMTNKNSIMVNYTLTPCIEASAPLYDAYQLWSSPDMGDFIEKLRHSYKLIKESKHHSYGEEARKTIVNNFSNEINSDRIANIIRDIQNGKYTAKKTDFKDIIKEISV